MTPDERGSTSTRERSKRRDKDRARRVESDVECDVPCHFAYEQWSQFENFPEFMEGVQSVRPIGHDRLHWVAEVSGKRREWEAEVIAREPDRYLAWRSTSGEGNGGAVAFEDKGRDRCIVNLAITYTPTTTGERIGSALGMVKARVHGDLRRFKRFVEEQALTQRPRTATVQPGEELASMAAPQATAPATLPTPTIPTPLQESPAPAPEASEPSDALSPAAKSSRPRRRRGEPRDLDELADELGSDQ